MVGNRRAWPVWLLVCTLVGAGCTGPLVPYRQQPLPPEVNDAHFLLVSTGGHDTWAGLAGAYLGDPSKAWWIEAANPADQLLPGRRVVIPRDPPGFGGLRIDGWQLIPALDLAEPDAAAKDRTSPPAKTPAAVMEKFLDRLQGLGFATIGLDQFYGFLNFQDTAPPAAVVVTFDSSENGDRWIYDCAFASMRKRGMRAAVFVTVGCIGAPGRLGWAELTEMAAAGWDIGAAGLSGRDLTSMQPRESAPAYLQTLQDEIGKSRDILEKQLGRPCRWFAYPRGRANDLVASVLKKNGYRLAFTRKEGGNPFFADEFALGRTALPYSADAAFLKRTLKTCEHAELR